MPATEAQVTRLLAQALAALGNVGDSPTALQVAVEAAVARGDVMAAVDLLPWDRLTALQPALAAALQGQIADAGAALAFPTSGQVRFSFTATDPLVIRYAQAQAADLVRQITFAQREQVRQIITDSLHGHTTVAQAARLIQQRVGLHDRWATAVSNSWAATKASSMAAGATETRAEALADKSAAQYRTRLIKTRAETIARTEVQAAQNNGRFLGWGQAVDQGYAPRDSQKEWIVAPSGSKKGAACDICAPLEGQMVKWDQPFPNGVLMPPAHPRCRCTATLREPPAPVAAPSVPASEEPVIGNLLGGLHDGRWSAQQLRDAAAAAPGDPQAARNVEEAIRRHESDLAARAAQPFNPRQFGSATEARDWAHSVWGGAERYTAEQVQVVRDYTGSAYGPMNNALRSSKGKRTTKAIRTMDEAIERASAVPEDMQVVRTTSLRQLGITSTKGDPRALIGNEYVDHGYMSTSIGRSVKVDKTNNVRLNLRVRPGTKGIYVSGAGKMPKSQILSDYGAGENELILARGTKYRILGVRKVGEGWQVDAEII